MIRSHALHRDASDERVRLANLTRHVDSVIADDAAMSRARHAYLNSPPHGVHHTDAARLEHMRAAFRAAFGGQS